MFFLNIECIESKNVISFVPYNLVFLFNIGSGFFLCNVTEILTMLMQHLQHPRNETHLDAVRGLIKLRGFHPSASTSGARRSDGATSDKDKQICLSTLLRTGFDTEVCSYLAFHS